MESGAFRETCRHIKILSIFAFCRVSTSLNFNRAFINLSPNFADTLQTLILSIRVPSSVFLLSGGLHSESTQKVRVMIRSTVQLKRYLEDSAGFICFKYVLRLYLESIDLFISLFFCHWNQSRGLEIPGLTCNACNM